MRLAIRRDSLSALGRLPGTRPLDIAEWLVTDEAHAEQMALRDDLTASRRDDVIALDGEAHPAAQELLEVVIEALDGRRDYAIDAGTVRRPDAVAVRRDETDPLAMLGRLVQEDFCILQKRGAEHVLTGAVLCFPSGWLLAEKFLRPLDRIHAPVKAYDGDVAKRVQRLFDGVKPGRPLMRANLLRHRDADLFRPISEEARDRSEPEDARYLRSERQCILRLPQTDAVVFSIHTTIVRAK